MKGTEAIVNKLRNIKNVNLAYYSLLYFVDNIVIPFYATMTQHR